MAVSKGEALSTGDANGEAVVVVDRRAALVDALLDGQQLWLGE